MVKNCLVILVIPLCILVGCDARSVSTVQLNNEDSSQPVSEVTGTQFWEVAAAKPSTVVKHGVDVKGYFDTEQAPVSLSGPEFLSKSVGFEAMAPQPPIAFLDWYRITKGEPESHGEVTLTDAVSGEASYTVQVGSPAFLLSPSQQLIDGPPDELPEGLNYFKAYEILKSPRLSRTFRLPQSFDGGGSQRVVTAAAYLCLPAEEWHHEQFFGIEDPQSCFVVYGLEPTALDVSATTMDQFGIHELQLNSSDWLCVSATMSR